MNRQFAYHFVQNNNQQVLSDLLIQSIARKTRTADIYRILIAKAPDLFSTRILVRLSTNENKALKKLIEIYTEIFGPAPEIETTQFDYSYLDALLLLLEEELDSVAFVREILDRLEPGDIANDVYEYVILVDLEQEDLLGTLYSHYLHFIEE